jgi:MoaA/NifB/PqqE/SkfB family radical SAM enzyme/SAM-dependent methyltransferase
VKALVKVGYGCNEHCTFCHTQDVRDIQGESDEVVAKIRRAKALGHTMVVLSGGEPTIRPELVQWAALVAALDMDFGLVTNGLVLAYADLVETLCASRLRYVYMSLHAGVADVHDRIVRAESFDTALRALDNLMGRGLAITINCVVTRQNLAHLRGLVDVVAARPEGVLKFSATEPKGGALHLHQLVVPRIGEAARAVLDAMEYARGKLPDDRVRHGGFPLCLLPGHEHRFDDLRTHDYWTMAEIGEPDFFPVDDRNKLHPSPTCDDCRLRGPCPGIFREQHARHGDGELKPQHTGVRGNAFDWVLEHIEGCDALDDHRACPLFRDGVDPWEPGRHLFVQHDGKLARFRAGTRDFGDDEILRVKRELGQIYYDVSRKPAPDDFAADLVKLVRSEACRGCPQAQTCTGIFAADLRPVFADDQAQLEAELGTLAGDVLELGCGDGRTAHAWDDSRVRWLGVDPDEAALARTAARMPGATLRHGTAETILPELAAESFDHVVVLHAWNHLADPALVIDHAVRVLRDGGELWLADDAPFGLARTPRQTARARTYARAREHLRNDDAAAALARIAKVPAAARLALLVRRDVAPDTSNRWLLRYRRRPA